MSHSRSLIFEGLTCQPYFSQRDAALIIAGILIPPLLLKKSYKKTHKLLMISSPLFGRSLPAIGPPPPQNAADEPVAKESGAVQIHANSRNLLDRSILTSILSEFQLPNPSDEHLSLLSLCISRRNGTNILIYSILSAIDPRLFYPHLTASQYENYIDQLFFILQYFRGSQKVLLFTYNIFIALVLATFVFSLRVFSNDPTATGSITHYSPAIPKHCKLKYLIGKLAETNILKFICPQDAVHFKQFVSGTLCYAKKSLEAKKFKAQCTYDIIVMPESRKLNTKLLDLCNDNGFILTLPNMRSITKCDASRKIKEENNQQRAMRKSMDTNRQKEIAMQSFFDKIERNRDSYSDGLLFWAMCYSQHMIYLNYRHS